MSVRLPEVTRVYQNHHIDSTRWKRYTPRDDDIIITTSYKSGTTWMQNIVRHLVLGTDITGSIHDFSNWLGPRWSSIDERIAKLEAQTHRRCIKSHLALDGLPYFPQVKYVVVARDARDVGMSLWNHYFNYSDAFYDDLDAIPNRVGAPFPRYSGDIHDFWKGWMTRGWFEWEQEGYPFWGNLHHTQTYWNYRHLPNFLFVHFSNLLKDTHSEIKRLADYLEIDVTDEFVDKIVELTSFDYMKKNSDELVGVSEDFKGGSKAFINKGTNGRWKSVLSEEELKLYDDTKRRVLTPDCAYWLETGQNV